ncbi:MAG: diguanylate cyclase (GGDEF)-like protein/PAS domain S-box-containing protein [Psychroserpens sp.]|jgi:diguanylate cyclase (GGDEF)-like protein/PAS domain S-box-containing protein
MTVTIELLQSQILDLKAQVLELKNYQSQFELIIKNTGVGIWDWSVQTGKTTFNEHWANIIGYRLEELSPVSIQTWIKFAHPDDLKESDRLLKEHWAGGTDYYTFESRMKHKDGHWIWVYDTGQVIEWESPGVPKRMIGSHLDITQKKKTIANLNKVNKKLNEFSYLDLLTQIPNRRAYEERLVTEVAISQRTKTELALIVIDVDNFKAYNDYYGHEKGDKALFRLAQAIKSALPRHTDFLARYGGEEMVVILPHTAIDGALLTAKRIHQHVIDENIEHLYSDNCGVLTVSIGVSSAITNFNELFSQADVALYKAKKNGRNRYEIYADPSEISNTTTAERGDYI